jgi:hypothetical protein
MSSFSHFPNILLHKKHMPHINSKQMKKLSEIQEEERFFGLNTRGTRVRLGEAGLRVRR